MDEKNPVDLPKLMVGLHEAKIINLDTSMRSAVDALSRSLPPTATPEFHVFFANEYVLVTKERPLAIHKLKEFLGPLKSAIECKKD